MQYLQSNVALADEITEAWTQRDVQSFGNMGQVLTFSAHQTLTLTACVLRVIDA